MRILLILLALLAANTATAGWTLLGRSDSSTTYLDKDSVQFSGTFPRIRVLTDLKSSTNTSKGAVFSFVQIAEFDCVRNEFRYIEGKLYSEGMGQGKLVEVTTTVSSSIPVKQGATSQVTKDFVCNSQNRTASENRTAPETKASSRDDRCASWGLKHGTAEIGRASCRERV